MPTARIQRMAAPKPMVASMAGVPASNRNGTSSGTRRLGRPSITSSLRETMPPPTWYSGSARSRSRLP